MSERIGTNEVASLLGVSPRTVSSYAARGQMPKPSPCACCGHSPTWKRSEIDSWLTSRPGRGIGGGRPRKRP